MLAAVRSSTLRTCPELLAALRAGLAPSMGMSSLEQAPAAAEQTSIPSLSTLGDTGVKDPAHAARLQQALDFPVEFRASARKASPSEIEVSIGVLIFFYTLSLLP